MLRRSAVAACVVVLALAAWATTAALRGDTSADTAASGTRTSSTPGAAAPTPSPADGQRSSPSPALPGLSGLSGLTGLAAGGGRDGSASEVPPVTVVPETAGAAAPGRLPAVAKAPTRALVSSLPARLTTARGLLPDLPAAVAPLPGSRVTSSSLAPSRGAAQVALTARTRASVERVLTHYRVVLGRFAMSESAAPAVGGSTAVRFVRGRDVLVVTARPDGGSTDYSVIGTLHPGRG